MFDVLGGTAAANYQQSQKLHGVVLVRTWSSSSRAAISSGKLLAQSFGGSL